MISGTSDSNLELEVLEQKVKSCFLCFLESIEFCWNIIYDLHVYLDEEGEGDVSVGVEHQPSRFRIDLPALVRWPPQLLRHCLHLQYTLPWPGGFFFL